jgi:hypothetical protein
MTQRTIDLLVKIAIEIVDWINILLKEKRRPDNCPNHQIMTQSK